MKTTLQSLQESISNAVDMIDQSQLVSDDLLLQQSTKYSINSLDFTNANSLLDKCEQVTNSYKKTKPVIRVIHHLACSGGTLISKCISAMPNVYLLSEAHPFSTLHMGSKEPKFSPCDLVSLARHANIPQMDELAANQFLLSLKSTNNHVSKYGGTLILRDHCHSDFCIDKNPVQEGAIYSVLKNDFKILSVITIRNPIDCFLSLVKNRWEHFNPFTFDEYCKRVLSFLAAYPDVNVFKYEEFVDNPMRVLEEICVEIELPYSESFEHIFDLFSVTGGSGRKSHDIKQRERMGVLDEIQYDIDNSEHYKIISQMFGY
jgi:hypothetical protein